MDDVYVVIVAVAMFAAGIWLSIGFDVLDAEDGVIEHGGERFVRVSAEQEEVVEDFVIEEYCEFWECDKEILTGEFINCDNELRYKWISSDLNCSDFDWEEGIWENWDGSEHSCTFEEFVCEPVYECVYERLVRRRC